MVQVAAGTLDAALEALLRGAASHIEPVTRRTCVQVHSKPAPPCRVSACLHRSFSFMETTYRGLPVGIRQ